MPAARETVLILGGTAEAAALAARLAGEGGLRVITSLAGRTADPASLEGEVRTGGFGGVEGMIAYFEAEGITQVYDATHPFARTISAHATEACARLRLPLMRLERPVWQQEPGDDWRPCQSLEAAVNALPSGATAFLALGRQHIDVFSRRSDCRFLLRMVDAPLAPLPFAKYELAIGKPSPDPDSEMALMQRHGITHLVCRNSGGAAGYGKIEAARRLAIPVLLINRAQD
ncbi:cobalt-precorrin-6A reductase [Allorhizobium undicola]|uniref:cobalt-precorrin-6A reductase n=1 Tax=Allorhizobium undicola TaxID=78527 RepID=UPI000481B742|nr:cobalt-precorrin-6A reductase [Allorhizobium undicola]